MHHQQVCYNIGNMQCKKAPFLMSPQETMQQKLQKTVKKTMKMAQNNQFLGLHQVLMEQKNVINASSIVVLQYRKYVVQKGSLFIVTLGNYATKTAKKTVRKTVKMAQNSQFLGLHQVLMEQKNILNVLSIVVL